MTEQILKRHLIEKYGDFTLVRLTGGYTNETFFLNGTRPPLVAKIANFYNLDIQNEVNCLKITQETGLVPKVYDLIEENNVQITIMEYREGQNGQTFLDNNDLDRAKKLYKSLGNSLSESIHSKKYSYDPNEIKTCNLQQLDLNLDFVPDILKQKSKEILGEINDTHKEWVLTHGDFGIHNVLYTPYDTLTILDWEWAEWANPLTDIGWVCWFTRLHYPEHAKLLNTIFIEEYKNYKFIDITSEKIKAYCVYKVWKILNKVKRAPQEVKEEWNRRLEWTIEIDII